MSVTSGTANSLTFEANVREYHQPLVPNYFSAMIR